MAKINLKEINKFFEPISTLKLKKRHGWEIRDIENTETIGSHIFGASMIGWYLARKEHLDATRVIKLILVHDMVKAYIPDITPQDKDYSNIQEIELTHLVNFIKNLPKELKKEFVNLFQEYQKHTTDEARLAREADKLDTLQQAIKYQKLLKKPVANEFFKTYKCFFQTKTGIEIYERLKKEHKPE